jgi:hypothetical protein
MLIFDTIPQHRLPQWLAQNNIIGLSLDRLPNGRLIAAEVRKDDDGELHVPLLEMDTDSFYALASRLNLPICDSEIASREEMEAFRRAQSERWERFKEVNSERSVEGWNKPEGGML